MLNGSGGKLADEVTLQDEIFPLGGVAVAVQFNAVEHTCVQGNCVTGVKVLIELVVVGIAQCQVAAHVVAKGMVNARAPDVRLQRGDVGISGTKEGIVKVLQRLIGTAAAQARGHSTVYHAIVIDVFIGQVQGSALRQLCPKGGIHRIAVAFEDVAMIVMAMVIGIDAYGRIG